MATQPGSEQTPEMAEEILAKVNVAKQKKETADQAFKAGQLREALRSYHESLLYLTGIDKNTSNAMAQPNTNDLKDLEPKKPKTEIDEIIEKIYSNMSACHIKLENWKRALETADKALSKNEDNYKAMFRKGKAQGEMGFFENAEKTLTELLKKNPADAPTINIELKRLRSADKEREKLHNQKFKGFLSRDKVGKKVGPAEPAPSASIVEVEDS